MELRGIHFKTNNGNDYYYDDCSGVCYPCPAGLKETLLELGDLDLDSLKQSENLTHWQNFILSRHKAYGAFLGPPLSFAALDHAELDKRISIEGMRQLFLIVTSHCNLRCRYCVYSEHYPKTFESQEKMSHEVAMAAVDYFVKSIKKSRDRNPAKPALFNFYGGEPLLNFTLIKDVVNYIKTLDLDNILFSISTNAVLLDDEISDFLIENKFVIAISIDGPEAEHDRNRVFADGSGSFKKVIANIENLWERHPDYNQLVFLVTYDIASNLNEIKRFFSSRDKFQRAVSMFSSVRDSFSDYYEQFSSEDIDNFFKTMKKLKDSMADNIINNDPLTKFGVSARFFQYLSRTILAQIGSLTIPASATCHPGDKISVLPDGSFQICERVPGCPKIGSIDSGLDFDKIADLIVQYNQNIVKDCQDCPVLRLCSFCFSHFWSGTAFEKPEKSTCKKHVLDTTILLSELFSLLEGDPGLSDLIVTRNAEEYSKLKYIQS